MKKTIYKLIVPLALCFSLSPCHAQQKTLDIAGIHQLISQSKSEYTKQVDAKNKQATVTANEQANLTLLTKMKNMYRTLQNRYSILGTAINVADIGITATPAIIRIIGYQGQIIALVEKNPALAALAYETEIEFAQKAISTLGYLTGLTLSISDVYQMKVSDRKLLFDYVLMQLFEIQELSGNLLNVLTYANLNSLIRAINPFQDYVDQDKALAESILQNAKLLKQ
jgi:hypothetical protein